MDSFALTLFTFLQIEEARRLEDLKTEWRQIEKAGLTAVAFHKPSKLADAVEDYKRRLKLVPSREEAIERAKKLFASVAPERKKRRR